MTTAMVIRTLFELFLVSAVVWGIFNENKLVAFERRVISAFKRRKLKVVKPMSVYTVVE